MIKPTKDNLLDELKSRVDQIKNKIPGIEDKYMSNLLSYELSIHEDIISLIEHYGDKAAYDKLITSNYTPIKDYLTGEPLKIGDKVETPDKNKCGLLIFDEMFNEYLIKSDTGGHIRTRHYHKIHQTYDFSIDTVKVECRKNPHKKKW